ncbi:conjugal transfer protein [Solirubrobacter ginsenosidimutans]|uniref:Conjugal transfer protein n=1 Tax=Solirubrobacter ginsenosidimutans TaxID=490573 RepID=A0A9X3SA59_9ACTN|nr:conjugal transfer protein [Solirubrobacter ginsenosidimutans]MDA0165658.1 conjugal transfer protein [Solirubrobacter ginsenosidimutans]
MAHLRFGASRPDRRSARALRTPADLFKRIGRGLLWMLVIVVLARGLVSLLATDGEASPTVVKPLAHPIATWPDEEARAFAADFARAYLTAPEPSLERYVTPDLAPAIAAEYAAHSRQDVGAVSVARVAQLGPSQALITVAAAVGDGTRYLAVPVARDARGGLVVSDLPALVGPPARAVIEAPSYDPVDSSERAAIEDVLKRFLTAYLAGDANGLEYLVPPGTRISPVGQPYELVGITSLMLAAPPKGDTRAVWTSVQVRDEQSRATYGLRYRLQLVRHDRWYVAAVTGG